MRIELLTLKEERAGAEAKMKNLESLLAAERRTRAEEEERVKNLTRLNGMLLMQVVRILAWEDRVFLRAIYPTHLVSLRVLNYAFGAARFVLRVLFCSFYVARFVLFVLL